MAFMDRLKDSVIPEDERYLVQSIRAADADIQSTIFTLGNSVYDLHRKGTEMPEALSALLNKLDAAVRFRDEKNRELDSLRNAKMMAQMNPHPNTGNAQQPKIFCSKCGAPNDYGSRFCFNCGTQI